MATAGDIAQASLKSILVQAADAPLEADEYADFLDYLNNFMADLEALNINLGYTVVDNISDEVTVPAGAIRGIIANLAIEVSPQYGGSISATLVKQAQDSMKTLRRLGMRSITSGFPATLPCGSGNEDSTMYDTTFYYGTYAASMALAGNTRSTAFTASATAVRVAGFWSQTFAKRLSTDINGTVTNVSALPITSTVTVNLSATGNGAYTFRLMRNGVSIVIKAATLTATASDVLITGTVILNPDDYVELWVEDDAATNAVVVTQAQFEVT